MKSARGGHRKQKESKTMNKKTFTNKWIEQRIGALQSPFDARNLEYMKLPTPTAASETPDVFTGLEEFSPTNFGRSQGSVGSCVGWDWSYCYETMMDLLQRGLWSKRRWWASTDEYVTTDMSAGWAYQESRKNSIPPVQDHIKGSTNLGAVRAAKKIGICTELLVPTDIVAPFDMINQTVQMYKQARSYRVSSYHNISNDTESIKAEIYGLLHKMPYDMPDGTHGKAPLMSAFPVYSNFKDSYDDGIVPMPEGRLLGGHSSPVFGWDIIDDGDYWTNFGSWGSDIGDEGKFHIPFDYPFYPNDWWLMKITPTPEPPKPTCIWQAPNFVTKILNWMDNSSEQYYHGREVK